MLDQGVEKRGGRIAAAVDVGEAVGLRLYRRVWEVAAGRGPAGAGRSGRGHGPDGASRTGAVGMARWVNRQSAGHGVGKKARS
jgi:hypothetical protein